MPAEAVRFAPAPLRLLAYATSNRTAWTLSDCLPALAADGPPCTLLERSPAPLVPYGT